MLQKKKKKNTFVAENACGSHFFCNLHPILKKIVLCRPKRRDARVVEEARLESVYTPKVYRGFESRSLRRKYKQETISKYNNNNLIN